MMSSAAKSLEEDEKDVMVSWRKRPVCIRSGGRGAMRRSCRGCCTSDVVIHCGCQHDPTFRGGFHEVVLSHADMVTNPTNHML